MVAGDVDYSYGDDYGFDDGDYSDSSNALDNALPLPPKDEDGNYVIHDMVFTPKQYNSVFGQKGDRVADGPLDAGIRGRRYRWKAGVIPYEFAPQIGKVAVRKDMKGHLMINFGCFFSPVESQRREVFLALRKVQTVLGKECVEFRYYFNFPFAFLI